MADFGQIPNNITLGAGESIRRNAGDTGFEAYNPMSGGDMTKAVYDPTNVNGDAFDMDNMVEGTTNKILTATEKTKLVNLGVVGPITSFTVTNNDDGTATISTCDVVLNSATDFSGTFASYTITGDTFTFTDGTEEYIVADYNSGTPIFRKETDKTLINGSSIVTISVCWRQGTTVHQANQDGYGLGLANKINRAMYNTEPYKRSTDGGLIITESTSPNPRTVLISSAVVYTGNYPQIVGAFNSSTDKMTEVYHVGGVWTYTDRLVYGNQSYDNGTDKVTADLNKYITRRFYRSIGDVAQVFYVNGTTQYNTVATAQLEAERTDLPIVLKDHCVLVGRAIIQLNATSGIMESAFGRTFTGASVINHNDTGNIQGGTSGEYYHLTQAQNTWVGNSINVFDDTKDPTGFLDNTNIDVSYDSTTRKITLTHSSGTISYYFNGVKHTLASPWISDAHTNADGIYYLTSTDGTNFIWSTTPFEYYNIQVAIAIFKTAYKFGLREVHSINPYQTHQEFHATIGTYFTGGDLSNYTIGSTTLKNPNTSATILYDEDNKTTNPTNTSGTYTIHYLTSTGTTNFTTGSSTIVPVSGNQPYYNQFTGGTWQQTLITDSNYMAVWQLALPVTSDAGSQAYRYLWVQGQNVGNLSTIQAITPSSINLGELTSLLPEFVFTNKVILRYIGGNWSITQVDKFTGSRVSQVSSPAGNYLSLVTTDATLTGAGTAIDPLSVVSQVSDTAYDATSWNGVTTIAPSKNAVRDKIETLASLTGATFTGAVNIEHASGLTLGKDETGGTPNIAGTLKLISAGDNAFYNTFTSGTNTANATYTLPTAMPAVSGYVLSCTDAGVMSWIASAGLAWNATIAGTSGTGLGITVSDSASAGTIGQSITIGNTQTQALSALAINTGTSVQPHIGTKYTTFAGTAIQINNTTTTAANNVFIGISYNESGNFGTTGNNDTDFIFGYNKNSSGSGLNTFIRFYNDTTAATLSTTAPSQDVGIGIYQRGAAGTAIAVGGGNNVNSSTNGLVNYTLSNTQSGATVMQKIELGTSAQGHTGLLVNTKGASTSQIGVQIDLGSTGTGTNLVLSGTNNTASPHFMLRFDGGNSATGFAGTLLGVNALETWHAGNDYTMIDFNPDFTATGANISARTSALFNFGSRTRLNRTQTVTRNYNEFYISRTTSTINAGANLTNQGSVLKLENVATQTAGTLTDSVTPLSIVQSANSTGVPISITQGAVVSTNYRKIMTETNTGITLWMGNGNTANGVLSGTAGDILFNGGSNKPEYCTGTTNWTALV